MWHRNNSKKYFISWEICGILFTHLRMYYMFPTQVIIHFLGGLRYPIYTFAFVFHVSKKKIRYILADLRYPIYTYVHVLYVSKKKKPYIRGDLKYPIYTFAHVLYVSKTMILYILGNLRWSMSRLLKAYILFTMQKLKIYIYYDRAKWTKFLLAVIYGSSRLDSNSSKTLKKIEINFMNIYLNHLNRWTDPTRP